MFLAMDVDVGLLLGIFGEILADDSLTPDLLRCS